MIESTQLVHYGREASETLVADITAAQQYDPLAPVTVIVPSNFVGLSIRRLIGSDTLRVGQRRGVANVSFVTPFQLAEHVAADLLLDSRPITNPVLGAAVRRALSDDPGPYAPVAEHEATEQALAGLFADLSNVDEAGLEAMLDEGSTAATLAVRFHRSIAAHLRGFHTERDLAVAAAGRPDLGQRLVTFGHVVWYLPTPTSAALADFIGRVLHDATSSSVVVGVSGAADADEPVWRVCAVAGVSIPTRSRSDLLAAGAASADHVVSVTDAVEEVRETCARSLGLIADGVAPHRIGIFFPTPDPYVRIIEQQFAAAGLTANGPNPRRLAESVAGRVLLAALDLPAQRWRRDRVIALVSSGPLRSGDDRVRPTAWDELSRDAGVVGELGDWRTKLQRLLESTDQQLAELDPADEHTARWHRTLTDRVHDIPRLLRFVDLVSVGVRAVSTAESWRDKSVAATELLVSLLGPEHRHGHWPESEQDAFARVEAALARLGALDDVEPSPSAAVFVRALRSELDVSRGRRGRFGHGVMYGPIGSAIGHDLDAVFVLGAAEGVLPVPRRDDAILPERVRISSLDQLESKSARLHHQHRAFLAALASAPVGHRTIMFPRGSLRSSRHSLPSRWLLDSVSALVGHTVHASDFGGLGDDIVETVASFQAGITGSHVATSIDERDAVAFGRSPEAVVDRPLAALVGRGLEMQLDRASDRFTEFDGNLGRVDTSLGDHPISPSRLETWASCGFRYFMRHVLEVSDRDDPERTDELSALDRGSLIHRVLERFIDASIEHGPPAPSEPWGQDARSRLHTIAAQVTEEYEASGRTGRAINWRVQRDDLHDVLDRFLLADDEFRRSHLATPDSVELDLGVKEGQPVRIELPSGRRLAIRGLIDRVDTTTDGRVVVSDYKSGRGMKPKDLAVDPFSEGTTLQLGAYSEGALRHTGRSSATAAYWMVETPGQERRGYVWTDQLRGRFHELLDAITTGIDQGVFAAAPGEWDSFKRTHAACGRCEYDTVCVQSRAEHADAKAAAPELQVRVTLSPSADVDGADT